MSRPRLRDDDGFTAVIGIMVLLIVLLFTGSAMAFALRSMDTSRRDRASARALAAADAGVDRAGYLLNRTLLAEGGEGPLGVLEGVAAETACLSVSAGDVDLYTGQQVGAWCPKPDKEGGTGEGTTYKVRTSTRVPLASGTLLERRVIAEGRSGSVRRRVLVIYRTQLNAKTVTDVFRRASYVECTTKSDFDGEHPDAGCPLPPL